VTTSYDEVLSRINLLSERETRLRQEIEQIRKEREVLKAKINLSHTGVNRAEWVDKLPKDFWLPSHVMHKMLSNSEPSKEAGGNMPDLSDWHRKGSTRDALVNIGISIFVAYLAVQLLFVVLL